MWFCPDKYRKPFPDFNQELLKVHGTLEDKEAKILLAQFLRYNLSYTTFLLSKVQLAPFQEILLKGFLNRNFSMYIAGRGCGKSWIAAVYCILQCIFEPNTNILIAGPTFRTARFIFENIEKIVESQEAKLLFDAFGQKARRNDLFEWKINGGSIKAIPLNGEKIRGFRANVLVLDEFLLLPEEIVKNVLMPFLTAPQDMRMRLRVRKIEDALIKKGSMKEEDRMEFKSNIKMIALSSASYTFENLYKVYCDWISKIQSESGKEYENYDPDQEKFKDSKYFVAQLSYRALPEHMIDRTIVQEAKSSSSDASFAREYDAQFTDGSDSYFSAVKMHECTLKLGENPHILLKGNSKRKYILSIDPSFSKSPSADFFAMSVFELDEVNETATLVHSYALAGEDLIAHINYFYYLVTNFNIVMIIADNADGNFIESANESELFKKNKIEYSFFEFDPNQEGPKYVEEVKNAKRQYNLEAKRICFKQLFTSDFLRRANEFLQTNIDRKKIFFASNINGNDLAFSEYTSLDKNKDLNYEEFTKYRTILDFIDTQDTNIYGTKAECALIEVKTNAQGHQTFDLPQNLKRNTSPNRARRDRYTAILLGNWCVRCYFDIINTKSTNDAFTFIPFFIK